MSGGWVDGETFAFGQESVGYVRIVCKRVICPRRETHACSALLDSIGCKHATETPECIASADILITVS